MAGSIDWTDWCLSGDIHPENEAVAAHQQGVTLDAVWYVRGAIAGFHGRGILDCPYPEHDDDRRRYWLKGWAQSVKGLPSMIELVQ